MYVNVEETPLRMSCLRLMAAPRVFTIVLTAATEAIVLWSIDSCNVQAASSAVAVIPPYG